MEVLPLFLLLLLASFPSHQEEKKKMIKNDDVDVGDSDKTKKKSYPIKLPRKCRVRDFNLERCRLETRQVVAPTEAEVFI